MLNFKLPENDNKYEWTNHVKEKMVYYRISVSLIKRIVRFPKRKEEGVAPGTTAVMQPRGSAKTPQEIWVMYQLRHPKKSGFSTTYGKAVASEPKTRVISAWRYPGISPVGKKIPIPDEILQELESII